MEERALTFMLGLIVAACAVAGLFFLRFWRKSGDRIFAMFSVAFWLLAVNWTALAFAQDDEIRTWLYIVRLVAFLVILLAIADKNRTQRAPPRH
jgi:hypothetical protein